MRGATPRYASISGRWRLLVEEEPRGEVAGALRVDDVGLAVVGFGLAAVR